MNICVLSFVSALNLISLAVLQLQEMSTETNQLKNDLKNASDKVEEQSNQHEMTLNSLKMIQSKEKAGLLCEVDKVKKQLKGKNNT